MGCSISCLPDPGHVAGTGEEHGDPCLGGGEAEDLLDLAQVLHLSYIVLHMIHLLHLALVLHLDWCRETAEQLSSCPHWHLASLCSAVQ